MKNVLSLVLGLVIVLGAVGCNDDTMSPMGVVTRAYNALRADDLGAFQSTLTGSALSDFGSVDGMAKIKNKIGNNIVFFGEAILVKTDLLNPLNGKKTYDLPIKGSEIDSEDGPGTIMTAQVECTFTTLNDVPPSTSMTTTTECKIFGIK